jgi:hypothetical protein
MKDEKWMMGDFEEIAVGDMTEVHAKNALRIMIRKYGQKEHNEHRHHFDAVMSSSHRLPSEDTKDNHE